MNVDELRSKAAENGLSLNYVAKDEMVSSILRDLQGYDDLVLKGGTAINRVYVRNKRFSEDIDFDIVFSGTPKQAIPRTQEIISKVKERLTIAPARIMKNTIRYDIYFTNPLAHRDRIMLEFSIKEHAKHYEKRIVNAGFVPADPALLNVYDVEELIRQKIECILNRTEAKDFFDLHHLLQLPHKKVPLNKQAIRERMSFTNNQLRETTNIINHYLPIDIRPNWHFLMEELRKKIEDY